MRSQFPESGRRARRARTVYVLHVGRIERPLTVVHQPWEVGLVAFEITAGAGAAGRDVPALPADVQVHVLPVLQAQNFPRPGDLAQLRYRDRAKVGLRMERAYQASASYLAQLAGQ